ncbi:P-loop NTPase fold protein [Ralstonia sp. NFACC01]|uniref:KAP family P-loop NTPase fold protein n=1 Tax=Ralstonia sp. NFACC01 TaxID=1566294 RepID=UPI0008EFB323|nr:P-loop NTPase fold protein [Ralstonia sp. NFACC01]SFO86266.1 KAP family P-loop domain-containing protein [Ralstonia sp. NFACC01]
MSEASQLTLPTDRWDTIVNPFEGDVLDRRRLAEQLTGYLARLRLGAVIALDAPWGEGKTWFARHWAAYLKAENYRVGWIDAFENDYVEDPFLLLAAEVRRLSAADKSLAERLSNQAAQVGKALMPMAAKMTINLVGKAVGTADLASEWSDQVAKAGEKGADAAQAWVKRRIEQHDKERDSMRAFRKELETFAKGNDDKPVVIIIDELDRCRPAFAVRLLERIKHYFDVPNLVFVLVMNRRQLETAVKGVYGAETDAATYLGKFLHLSLALPRPRSWELDRGAHFMRGFVSYVLRRYDYGDDGGELGHHLTVWAEAFRLSLREVERACAMCFLVRPRWPALLSFLVALRVKYPELFDGIRADDSQANERGVALLQDVVQRIAQPGGWVSDYVQALVNLLSLAQIRDDEQALDDEESQLLFGRGMIRSAARSPVKTMRTLMQSLDFEVQ